MLASSGSWTGTDRLGASFDERWDLIDYIRPQNAGTTMRSTGAWSPRVQAPSCKSPAMDEPSPYKIFGAVSSGW